MKCFNKLSVKILLQVLVDWGNNSLQRASTMDLQKVFSLSIKSRCQLSVYQVSLLSVPG